jgi:hypothetical protein
MKTLTEITNEQAAREDRAWRYEQALRERDRALRAVKQLEETLAKPDVGLAALQSIHALCADIPQDVQTQGRGFVSGGFRVRDLVMTAVGDALAVVSRRRRDLEARLPIAREKLTAAEAHLAQFTARGSGVGTLPEVTGTSR